MRFFNEEDTKYNLLDYELQCFYRDKSTQELINAYKVIVYELYFRGIYVSQSYPK